MIELQYYVPFQCFTCYFYACKAFCESNIYANLGMSNMLIRKAGFLQARNDEVVSIKYRPCHFLIMFHFNFNSSTSISKSDVISVDYFVLFTDRYASLLCACILGIIAFKYQ